MLVREIFLRKDDAGRADDGNDPNNRQIKKIEKNASNEQVITHAKKSENENEPFGYIG